MILDRGGCADVERPGIGRRRDGRTWIAAVKRVLDYTARFVCREENIHRVDKCTGRGSRSNDRRGGLQSNLRGYRIIEDTGAVGEADIDGRYAVSGSQNPIFGRTIRLIGGIGDSIVGETHLGDSR